MDCKLIAKQIKGKTKDGRDYVVNNFYLRFANGVELKVQPNKYEDDKGEKHNNEYRLLDFADVDLPF